MHDRTPSGIDINKRQQERPERLCFWFTSDNGRGSFTGLAVIASHVSACCSSPGSASVSCKWSSTATSSGKKPTKNKNKGSEVFPVRTDDFQTRIIQVCNERDDEWASVNQGRLQSISDLHAADALYHQACSVNFRTNKKIPLTFSPEPKKKENSSRGRPAAYVDYFLNS
ncbi:Hypothetical predicted protein [Mytilus galloprovincialis]|uniref:Uncharacterized protein n=1 Tax=Mytilus galloprovincialis TaxID=29158 RepID=A0A8B6FL72_MYTGA|nr:Hypothetical predicted protein [Mytilus galloprovincialis]